MTSRRDPHSGRSKRCTATTPLCRPTGGQTPSRDHRQRLGDSTKALTCRSVRDGVVLAAAFGRVVLA
jgi:hypothetical protein